MSGVRLTMVRRGDALVPTAQMFLDDLRSIPEGQSGVITWHRVRSLPHHRRFFAKLRKLCQAGAWDNTEDSLLSYIKIGIGYVVTVIDSTSSIVSGSILAVAEKLAAAHGPMTDEGKLARFVISIAGPKTFFVPKSINFDTLDQTQFADFEKRADEFTARVFGIDPEDLMQQAADLAAGPTSHADKPQAQNDDAPPVAASPSDAYAARLQARLERLAERLRKDTVADVDAAWADLQGNEGVQQLKRVAPLYVEDLVKVCRMRVTAGWTDEGFKEVLGKLIDAALAKVAA